MDGMYIIANKFLPGGIMGAEMEVEFRTYMAHTHFELYKTAHQLCDLRNAIEHRKAILC